MQRGLHYAVLLSAGVAMPATAAPTISFSGLDQDKDGFISIKEAVADPNLLAVFGKIDKNGDGKLSIDEVSDSDLITQRAF
ncbi:EF-hand domain-containing protein [Aestuariibacter halophilus]|uniref:EF-hand domain-containing protein n=1 Tax=Fluctibacter halophilus TaxID=226011 RepID=A0ABS8G6G9_9ALTE|nr:EF-hand domain-containing protein [Aestuariibacter halophilus]MCC2616118.1 EF-hand domain-containing protein [Aestuariibacter halophilus]